MSIYITEPPRTRHDHLLEAGQLLHLRRDLIIGSLDTVLERRAGGEGGDSRGLVVLVGSLFGVWKAGCGQGHYDEMETGRGFESGCPRVSRCPPSAFSADKTSDP
jgi:hypothetical protein